ncbi:MAG: sarcosine oxidase subunit gamma [Formosimonas sp.]
MLNFTPYWQSPLHEALAQFKPSASPTVYVTERTELGYITLRGLSSDTAFLAKIAQVLGGALPTTPMAVAIREKATALWLSPDEWLLVCDKSRTAALLTDLLNAVEGLFAQVVDNSGGYTSLDLSGAEHLMVLRHLTPFDVENLQVGQCAATVMSKAGVILLRTDEEHISLICRRSFADYIWRLLQKAATPYGLAVGFVG